jgi:hypothetical protein
MKETLLTILIVIIKIFVLSIPMMYLLNWIIPLFLSTFSINYLQTCGLMTGLLLIRLCAGK